MTRLEPRFRIRMLPCPRQTVRLLAPLGVERALAVESLVQMGSEVVAQRLD